MTTFDWNAVLGRERTLRPAGALNAFVAPTPRPDLAGLSLADVTTEVIARLASGEAFTRDGDLVVAGQLQDLLKSTLDVHLNRFSRRRYFDLTQPILAHLKQGELAGGTVVDLGAGSLNPFVFGFLFLMLGAERAYAVDLDPVQDPDRAIRALAAAAEWLLVDPVRTTGRHDIDRHAVLEHLRGFDLALLAAGDSAGVAADRLIYLSESIDALSIEDGAADLVSSVSLLEHVDDVAGVIDSLWRITTPGGLGHHVVDFVDHRLYGGQVESPFEFLKIQTTDAVVHGCNRVRSGQLRALFEQRGFLIEAMDPCRTDPLTDQEQRQFVEPYRSMAREDLTMTCARLFVRRP